MAIFFAMRCSEAGGDISLGMIGICFLPFVFLLSLFVYLTKCI